MSVRFEGDGAIEIPARHFPSDYINKDIHANRVEKDLVDWKTLVTDSVAMFGMGMDVDDWNATPLVPRAVAPHAVDAVTPIAERDAPAGLTEQSLNMATTSVTPPSVANEKPTSEPDAPAITIVGKVAKKPKGPPLAETSILVQAALDKCFSRGLRIKRDDIATEIGVSGGWVSETPAWMKYQEEKKAKKQSKIRQVQLSTEMLAGIPANIERPEHSAELAELVREQEAEIAADNRGCKPHQKRRHDPS